MSEPVNRTSIKGLILAGGQSTRMGEDKAFFDYHGIPQYQFLNKLLHEFVEEVYISCRPAQKFDDDIPRIIDQYDDIGPMAGILSAFKMDASCAWLAVACDLPYVDAATLTLLFDNRDKTREATFFIDPETSFPEPLLTIYEPTLYPILLKSLSAGQTSLNRVLLRCDSKRIKPPDVRVLRSANTKEEAERIKRLL